MIFLLSVSNGQLFTNLRGSFLAGVRDTDRCILVRKF